MGKGKWSREELAREARTALRKELNGSRRNRSEERKLIVRNVVKRGAWKRRVRKRS